MPVPFHPGPEWCIAFHELDPSTDRQCIYYTQKEERCCWLSDDNERAIELHRLISTLPHGTVKLNLLIDYVLCYCCMFGRAKHRIRIGDRQELLPLAERWLDEVQRHANATTYHPTSFIPRPRRMTITIMIPVLRKYQVRTTSQPTRRLHQVMHRALDPTNQFQLSMEHLPSLLQTHHPNTLV
jgi:hypothetical protein